MIRQEGSSISAYLEAYQQKQKELLAADTDLFGKHLPHSMVTLYQLQLGQLSRECPAAIRLLQYSALLAPDAIPLELLREELLGEAVPEAYQYAQQQLLRYSLWQKQGTDSVRIHRLIQEVVLWPLKQEDFTQIFVKLADRLVNQCTKETTALEDEQRLKALFPSLEAFKELAERKEVLKTRVEVANVLFYLGNYYCYQTAQYSIAKNIYEQALIIYEKWYGFEHPKIVATLNKLGTACGGLGNYDQWKDFLLRSLSIQEKHYGPNHTSTGAALFRLGIAYSGLGNYEQAKLLLTRALEIDEKHYGKEHREVARDLYTLVKCCASLYDYEQQKAMLTRALGIEEKHYGKDHLETRNTLSQLGTLYKKLGDYAQAKELLTRALKIVEKAYGSNHPNTANALDRLSSVYGDLGDYKQKEDLLTRALNIIEKHYGKDHPETSAALKSLSSVYGDLGDYAQQKALALKAVKSYEKHLTEKYYSARHPALKRAYHDLACCYFAQAIRERKSHYLIEAEYSYQRALELGQHSNVYAEYANFLYFNCRYQGAIFLLTKAIQLKDDTSLVYYQMEKHSIPEQLKREVDVQNSISFGAIIFSYYLLILIYKKLNQVDEAINLLAAYQGAVKSAPEAMHYSLLGYSYKELAMFNEAALCFEEACKLKEHYLLAEQNQAECLSLAGNLKHHLVSTSDRNEKLKMEQPEVKVLKISESNPTSLEVKNVQPLIFTSKKPTPISTNFNFLAPTEKFQIKASPILEKKYPFKACYIDKKVILALSEKKAGIPKMECQQILEEFKECLAYLKGRWGIKSIELIDETLTLTSITAKHAEEIKDFLSQAGLAYAFEANIPEVNFGLPS